ncbi:MAG: glycosyltransferase [Taibaiella sp.]|nr:glycosyltransferase [Taibaiella sp.]
MILNNGLIQNANIVVTGQQPWDVEIGSNCKNLAIEFSKHNKVLYVNSPLDRISLLRNKNDEKVQKRLEVIKGKKKGLEKINDNLWVYNPDKIIESINWITSQKIFELLNKVNNRRFATSIRKAINELGFRDFILFNDNDIFRSFYLKDFLQPKVSIYYSRDFLLAVDYWKSHGKKLEPELIAKSDLCIANSTYLANYCKQYNPRSYYVGQGCDLEIFTNGIDSAKPADVQQIVHPVIGYVGALQSIRLDVELLKYIANMRPEWQIVLVGPEDEVFKNSELHKMSNVHFTGHKDLSELPAYINSFDVCINPQLLNEVTIGNYPRKIDEYLALGKPVVATETDAMSVFAGHCYLGKNNEDYIRLIEEALIENSDKLNADRRAFAASHTWENNVKEIYKAIVS